MLIKKHLYPILILLLLGSFLCFSTWSAMRAAESGPEVSDADYYSKGLKYTSTLLEKRAAVTLGWKVSTRLAGRTLLFHLNDKQGHPVKSAQGTIFLYLPDTASSTQFSLQEVEAGIYEFDLPAGMTGRINARLEFEYAGARMNRQLLINLQDNP
jgi:nitrogen fixation protein FixH